MRHALSAVLVAGWAALVGGLAGCGSSDAPAAVERLPGRWHGQMIVYEDQVRGKLPPEKIAELSQMQFDFEFRPDGSMVTSGNDGGRAYSTNGKWELVKQEGDVLTIKSVDEGGNKDVKIEFDGSDTFYIPLQTEVAELGAMRFTRTR